LADQAGEGLTRYYSLVVLGSRVAQLDPGESNHHRGETVLALLNFTHFVSSSGYLAIFVLSVMQSCCVPTSSELTLGFAGVLAAEGKLSLPGAIAAGVTGELLGAYLAWVIGYYGGRAFVESEKKMKKDYLF
jgi:membrane protein DedA with SNARE-associated domain